MAVAVGVFVDVVVVIVDRAGNSGHSSAAVVDVAAAAAGVIAVSNVVSNVVVGVADHISHGYPFFRCFG